MKREKKVEDKNEEATRDNFIDNLLLIDFNIRSE